MFKKIQNILYNSSLYLLISLGVLVILTSVLWLLKVPMTNIHLVISLIIAAIITLKLDKDNWIISILLSVLVIIASILIAEHVYDQSDDGNTYHKESIGMITKGWNPIYDNYSTFAHKNNLTDYHKIWAEHYPKTTWIIGSSVYKITKNIETAKFYNIIICFIGFGIFLKLLFPILKNKLITILASLIVVINPIICSQIFSLYLDGFMGILFFIIVLEMYYFINDTEDKTIYLSLALSIILICNCKFTGLAYAGIFCLAYYLYYVIKKVKLKKFNQISKSFLYFFITVIISVFIVGSSSYIKNIVTESNPFYPLMGKGKLDIMTYLQPASFKNMSPLQKNYYSIFSKTANIGVFNDGKPQLKRPFTYDAWEIKQISYDTRIGGYGVLFSGIFIVSLLIIIIFSIFLIKKKKYNDLFSILIPIFIIILLMIFLSDGWWARYAPYTYLIVLLAVILLGSFKNKGLRILYLVFCYLILLNSHFCIKNIIESDIPKSGLARNTLTELEGKSIDIYLTSDRFTGILYNLEDHNIDYKIIKKNDKTKTLYGRFANYKVSKNNSN